MVALSHLLTSPSLYTERILDGAYELRVIQSALACALPEKLGTLECCTEGLRDLESPHEGCTPGMKVSAFDSQLFSPRLVETIAGLAKSRGPTIGCIMYMCARYGPSTELVTWCH